MSFPVSDRLIYRFYDRAARDFFIGLVTDEAVMKFVDRGVFERPQAEELWHKLTGEFYRSGRDTIYAVYAREDSRYIGHAALRPRPERERDWEISYMLVREEWGKGFATEIAASLIEFGFAELKLTQVFATISRENEASVAVVLKAGMSQVAAETDEAGGTLVFSMIPRS